MLNEQEEEIAQEIEDLDAQLMPRLDTLGKYGLFLSRIREEQKPEAYIVYGPLESFLEFPEWLEDGAKSDPLFITPPAAPCDCSELVDALENAKDVLEHLIARHRVVAGHQIAISCFDRINEALAKRQPQTLKVGDTCDGPWPTMKGEE